MRNSALVGLFVLIALFTMSGIAQSANHTDNISQPTTKDTPLHSQRALGLQESECPDLYEPNDSFNQAALVLPGTTIQAYICTQGEWDYYKFYVEQGKTITVTLFNIPSVHDYSLRLADPSRGEVATSNQPGNGDEQIIHNANMSGVWYAVIRGDQGASYTQAYRLRVLVGPSKTYLYLPWLQQ